MKIVYILGVFFIIQMNILQSNCKIKKIDFNKKKIDKKQNKRLASIEVNFRH